MEPHPHGATSQTIFINPRFKNAHINPNFLQKSKTPSAIHVNPKFLNKDVTSSHTQPVATKIEETPLAIIPPIAVQEQSSFQFTNRKFVRPGITPTRCTFLPAPSPQDQTPLIKLGSRKLVRASQVAKNTENEFPITIKPVVLKPIQSKYKIVKRIDLFKIDRRSAKVTPVKKLGFVGRYALNRASSILTPKKITISEPKLLKIGSSSKQPKTTTQHKTLEFLEINGLRYKSSKNKLQKTEKAATTPSRPASTKPQRNIFIRGDKYQLIGNGKSLVRSSGTATPMKRIDLGGFTFVACSPNTFIRTEVHRARTHLLQAKQKSILCLSRKSRVKSNLACPIFQRLGRCVAFDLGKCHRVHDRKHVAICARFLRGSCTIDGCLLSHDVTLSKMPTCKFYLQGCCVKQQCPYLHKKVSEKTEVCQAFVNGFCADADQCKRRHEFPAAKTMSKKLVDDKAKKKCYTTQASSSTSLVVNKNCEEMEIETDPELRNERYFLESDKDHFKNNLSEEEDANSSKKPSRTRPRLGDLPAFIPLE